MDPVTIIQLGDSGQAPISNASQTGGQIGEAMAEDVRTGAAFGPGENADDTRQAQHQMVNDSPVDVNVNAVVARSQVLTFDVIGKAFSANADRRDKIMDLLLHKMADK